MLAVLVDRVDSEAIDPPREPENDRLLVKRLRETTVRLEGCVALK